MHNSLRECAEDLVSPPVVAAQPFVWLIGIVCGTIGTMASLFSHAQAHEDRGCKVFQICTAVANEQSSVKTERANRDSH